MFGALACYQTRLLATPISYRCRFDNNKNNWWNPMLNGRCFFLFTVATEVNWAFTKPGIPDARANRRWTDGSGKSLWDNIPCCALWKTQYIFSRSKMVERPGGSTPKPESKQMNVPIHSAVGLCSWTIVGVDSKQFRRIVCQFATKTIILLLNHVLVSVTPVVALRIFTLETTTNCCLERPVCWVTWTIIPAMNLLGRNLQNHTCKELWYVCFFSNSYQIMMQLGLIRPRIGWSWRWTKTPNFREFNSQFGYWTNNLELS
jgi:hypothetical protein